MKLRLSTVLLIALAAGACQAPPASVDVPPSPLAAAEAEALRAEFLELHRAFQVDEAHWIEQGGIRSGLPTPVEVACPIFEDLAARGSDEALVWVAARMPAALPTDRNTTLRTEAALEACVQRLDAQTAEPWEAQILEAAFAKGAPYAPATPLEPVYRRLSATLEQR